MKLFKLNLIFFIIILLIYIKYLNIIENKFYNNIRNVHNPSDIDVIINKNNKLNKKYKPNDLILLNHKYSNKNKFLRKEALINFEKLSEDASKKGFSIIAVSTYRSYIYQNELYNYYYKFKKKNMLISVVLDQDILNIKQDLLLMLCSQIIITTNLILQSNLIG